MARNKSFEEALKEITTTAGTVRAAQEREKKLAQAEADRRAAFESATKALVDKVVRPMFVEMFDSFSAAELGPSITEGGDVLHHDRGNIAPLIRITFAHPNDVDKGADYVRTAEIVFGEFSVAAVREEFAVYATEGTPKRAPPHRPKNKLSQSRQLAYFQTPTGVAALKQDLADAMLLISER